MKMDDFGAVLEELLTSVLVKSEPLDPERDGDGVNYAHFQEDLETLLDLIESTIKLLRQLQSLNLGVNNVNELLPDNMKKLNDLEEAVRHLQKHLFRFI